ncbi:MAG: RNA-binding protein [Spirochaetales bacterium]|nr:RNA-binding protein [Spirochaetales bacterium]
MPKKLYVGNISFNSNEEELGNHFAQFGEVLSVNIITDRYTNQSKGFGFVEMQDEDAADAAISALNGTDFAGRELKVNVARDRNDAPRRNNFR